MNKIIFSTIILFFIFSYSTNAQKNKFYNNDNFTFVFYNTENLFDTIDCKITKDEDFTPKGDKSWNTKRYNKKISDIAWVISAINKNELPEIVGLCEVEEKSVLKDLVNTKLLKKANYKIVFEEDNNTRGIDVALLYNANKFKEISHKLLKVKNKDKFERGILYVKGIISDDTFHIFVNHWKSRRGGADKTESRRIRSAKVLRNKVDEILLSNSKANIVIMGDFNDTPTNKSLNKTLNATNNFHNLKPTELYNLMYNKAVNEKGTNSYKYKWYMLDNLIVSRNLIRGNGYKITSDGGQIFYDTNILYNNVKANMFTPSKTYGGNNYYGGFSDHLPIYFTIQK